MLREAGRVMSPKNFVTKNFKLYIRVKKLIFLNYI